MKRSTTAKFSFALASGFCLMLLYYALCSGVTTFKEMVTKKVIGQAVACVAQDLKGPDWETKSYTARHGIIRMASKCARYAVYAREFGEDWDRKLDASIAMAEAGANQNVISYWEKPENGGGSFKTYYRYLNIKELAREHLKSRERLVEMYLSYKGFILAEIAKYPGLGGKIGGLLAEILPPDAQSDAQSRFFISHLGFQFELQDMMNRLTLLKDQWDRASDAGDGEVADAAWREWHLLEEDMAHRGITKNMINTHEWLKCREAEGGDDLMDEWMRIAWDLELELTK